jgi:TonB family protein
VLLGRWLPTSDEPVAAPGTLRVDTQPAGMSVWIDDAQAGPSPLMLRDLPPGTHRIRVLEPGYAPAELTLELTPGTTAAPLRFVMTPVAARLTVSSVPAEATVLLDGRRIGATPFDGFVQGPGPHELRVEKKGHRPHVRRVEATPGVALKVDVHLVAIPPEAVPPEALPTPPPAVASVATRSVPPLREGDLVELDATVQPPRRIEGPTPSYPDAARRLKLAGSVLIEMVVTEKGLPERIRILESAGAVLDETVIEAVGRWRFEPASKAGVRVRTRWQYRHTFLPR